MVAAENYASIASLVNSTRKIVNKEKKDSLENIPYFIVCLAQWHRLSTFQLVPKQLHPKYIQNHMENLKALPNVNLKHTGRDMDTGVHRCRQIGFRQLQRSSMWRCTTIVLGKGRRVRFQSMHQRKTRAEGCQTRSLCKRKPPSTTWITFKL